MMKLYRRHRVDILEILINVTTPFRRKLTTRFGAN